MGGTRLELVTPSEVTFHAATKVPRVILSTGGVGYSQSPGGIPIDDLFYTKLGKNGNLQERLVETIKKKPKGVSII